jgi:hypothetical protein
MSHIIQAFLPSGGRAKNDANNRAREDALVEMTRVDIPECANLKQDLHLALASLCPFEFSRYELTKKAGRGYSYDFDLAFYSGRDDAPRCVIKLEFKYGSTSVEKLPQFYQKNTGWGITPVLYHEFFYDGPYLDEIRLHCPDAPEKPDKETYMRHIMKTSYSCHPFFQYLYDKESIKQKDKSAIVKRSIREFLAAYGSQINVAEVKRTFDQTQTDKQYLLYDPKSKAFLCQSCDFLGGELTFVCVKKNNVIVLTNGSYEFQLLLRWKNHQGILNPAWQVSVKKM